MFDTNYGISTSSTLLEKDDLVVRLVELLVSVSDIDLDVKRVINHHFQMRASASNKINDIFNKIISSIYTLNPFDPSGGKRTGSLYFTRENEVSTPPGSVAILYKITTNLKKLF